MQQKVQNKPLSSIMGIVLIVGIVAVLLVVSGICSMLTRYVNGTVATAIFWLIGGAIALYLMRTRVMCYHYTYNGLVLRIERAYGSRPRFVEDILLRNLNGIGTLDEMKKKHPNAKVVNATRKQCEFAPLAVAYTNSDGQRIALIQPNDEIRPKLYEALKK